MRLCMPSKRTRRAMSPNFEEVDEEKKEKKKTKRVKEVSHE